VARDAHGPVARVAWIASFDETGVKIGTPGLVAEVAQRAGAPLPTDPLIIGTAFAGAIAFSVLPGIQNRRAEARQIGRESPVSHLLHISELPPQDLTARVARGARRFILGV
jgi:hypothetical protein